MWGNNDLRAVFAVFCFFGRFRVGSRLSIVALEVVEVGRVCLRLRLDRSTQLPICVWPQKKVKTRLLLSSKCACCGKRCKRRTQQATRTGTLALFPLLACRAVPLQMYICFIPSAATNAQKTGSRRTPPPARPTRYQNRNCCCLPHALNDQPINPSTLMLYGGPDIRSDLHPSSSFLFFFLRPSSR